MYKQSNKFVPYLIVLNAVYCVFVVMNFVVSIMPGEPSTLPDFLDGALSLLAWPMVILHVVWIYVVHQDLQIIWPDYPVSPGKAMALLLIPGYNIWGIWAMWRVADSRLPRVMVGNYPVILLAVGAGYGFTLSSLLWFFPRLFPGVVWAILAFFVGLGGQVCHMLLYWGVRASLDRVPEPA